MRGLTLLCRQTSRRGERKQSSWANACVKDRASLHQTLAKRGGKLRSRTILIQVATPKRALQSQAAARKNGELRRLHPSQVQQAPHPRWDGVGREQPEQHGAQRVGDAPVSSTCQHRLHVIIQGCKEDGGSLRSPASRPPGGIEQVKQWT